MAGEGADMFVMIWNSTEMSPARSQVIHDWDEVNDWLKNNAPIDWPHRIVDLSRLEDCPVMFDA